MQYVGRVGDKTVQQKIHCFKRFLTTGLLGLLLALGGASSVHAAGYTPSITTAYPALAISPSAPQVNWVASSATCTVPSRYNVCDDGKSDIMAIGFNFTFGGVAYARWSMSTNGVIFFETAAVGGTSTGDTDYTPVALPTNAFGGVVGPPSTIKPALMPFWADLQKNASLAGANNVGQPANASFYQYELQTVSGKQVLVVQLKNVKYWNTTPELYVNLQVQIWSTGEVVYSYGTMQAMTSNPLLRIGLQYPGATVGCNTLANNQSTSLSNQSYLYTTDAAAAACPSLPTVNHYEIRHDAAATRCAEPVTVLACSVSTAPCPSASIINTQIINAAVNVAGTGSLATPNINPPSFNIEPSAPLQTINLTWALGSSGTATLGINAAVSATAALRCTNVAGTATSACTMAVANTACIAPPHHYEIQGPASGTTCANHIFTIKAWANAAQTTAYTAGVATGTLTSSGNPASYPSLGAFTIAAGASTVNITPITFPSAGTTTFSTTATPALAGATTCNFGGSTSCAFTAVSCPPTDFNCVETTANAANAADSDASTGRLYTKLAGTAFTFDVVARKADGSVLTTYASDANKSVTVELVDGSGATACASRSALSPAVSLAQNFAASDAGRKSFAFTVAKAYPDVRCRVTDTTTLPAVAKACSLDDFAIRPPAVTLNTTASAVAPSATDTTTVRAGAAFTLYATSAAAPNYIGTLARNATGSAPVAFTAIGGATPTAAIGTLTLTPATIATNPSVPLPSGNATYTEVGYLNLPSGAYWDANYTAVDSAPGDCVTDSVSDTLTGGKYGCNITHVAGSLGRFTPDHFDTAIIATAAPVAPIGCPSALTCPTNVTGVSGMVYANQPFNVQVAAKNVAGNATTNYQGAFAKANTLGAWNAAGGATANPGSGTLTNLALATTAFIAGVGTTPVSTPNTTQPTYTLGTSTTAPTDVYLRTTDAEGVTSQRVSGSVEAGLKVANGRIKIDNAYGSERLALPIITTVQYFNGTTWLTSSTDSATTYNSALTTATPTPGNVLLVAASGLGSPAGNAVSVVNPATAAVASGVRSFSLAAPMVPGHVNLFINAPIYLPSAPGLATFGVFRSPLIYRRENY